MTSKPHSLNRYPTPGNMNYSSKIITLDGKRTGRLFTDNWITPEQRKAVIIQYFFKFSFFQTSKKIKRKQIRHEFPDGKFIEVTGYVNVIDMDNLLIFLDAAREPYRSLRIGKKQYDRCILIPRKKLFGFFGYPKNKGNYHNIVRGSHKRLKSLIITHNLYRGVEETISLFSNVGYISKSKTYYFVISDEFENLYDKVNLKVLDLNDYFALKNPLAKILWVSLKILFDHEDSDIERPLRLETILHKAGKSDWIAKANNQEYFKTRLKHQLFPAFRELEEKSRFRFTSPRSGKYRLEAIYQVSRLYRLPRDSQSGENADENEME